MRLHGRSALVFAEVEGHSALSPRMMMQGLSWTSSAREGVKIARREGPTNHPILISVLVTWF